MQTNLSERSQKILQTTIKHYIATAEPVGSKTLVDEYDFQVSSATVRNILGRLEKAGFLYQPHISAGRIPSDFGYRTYVDRLLILDRQWERKIEQEVSKNLQQETNNFDVLLQRATQFLADISGYIALITLPQPHTTQLRHIHLVQISVTQVMLIVVTDSYQTQSILMNISLPLTTEEETEMADELQILANFLNAKLHGKTLAEIVKLDWQEIDRDFTNYTHFLQTLLKQLRRCLHTSATPQVIIYGLSEVLRQPEFSQLQQVKMLIHLLEQQRDQLIPLVFDLSEIEEETTKVNVKIGSENPLDSMRPCTLISATYRQKNIPVGSVGLIGPTRMLYEYTIPLVESTADYLSDALS